MFPHPRICSPWINCSTVSPSKRTRRARGYNIIFQFNSPSIINPSLIAINHGFITSTVSSPSLPATEYIERALDPALALVICFTQKSGKRKVRSVNNFLVSFPRS